jgi:hypothetical protein
MRVNFRKLAPSEADSGAEQECGCRPTVRRIGTHTVEPAAGNTSGAGSPVERRHN